MSEGLVSGDIHVGDVLPSLPVAVTARTVVMGASASRDWQPQHHDHAWAIERAGTKDIFVNTPHQAGWIQRYLTDWAGPRARLAKVRFRMRTPVFPGDDMVFTGSVTAVTTGADGCDWVDVTIALTVGDTTATECVARLAVPTTPDDNPWQLTRDAWTPGAAGDL